MQLRVEIRRLEEDIKQLPWIAGSDRGGSKTSQKESPQLCSYLANNMVSTSRVLLIYVDFFVFASGWCRAAVSRVLFRVRFKRAMAVLKHSFQSSIVGLCLCI